MAAEVAALQPGWAAGAAAGAAPLCALGLPKGRFAAPTRSILKAGGAVWEDRLRFDLPVWRARAYLLKASDMPRAVAEGQVDLAVVPEEWVMECEMARPGEIARLGTFPGWLQTRLSFFAAPGAAWPPSPGASVATCFPELARAQLRAIGIEPRVIYAAGSTEAFVGTLADYGFDCVETGATLAQNGLVEIFCAAPQLGMAAIGGAGGGGRARRLLAMIRAAVAASRAA